MDRVKPTHLTSFFIRVSQITASRVCQLYLRIFGSYTLRKSFTVSAKKRYLFVANHQSQLDPFSVFAVLSFRENLAAAPVRFLTAKTVYYSPLLPLLKSMGCYPTRGSRDKIIAESVGYLRNGYNIFMFPEGKRTTRQDSEPRRGVSDLIKAASLELNVQMILVHIEWERVSFWRRHATISMREAPQSMYRKNATAIMNALYEV